MKTQRITEGRRLSRRQFLLTGLSASAGLAVTWLAGCETEGPPTEGTPAGRAQPPSPWESIKYARDVLTNRTPRRGGTLQMFTVAPVPSVDPARNAAIDPAIFHGLHSSYLLRLSTEPGRGLTYYQEEVVGDLATRWEIVDPTTLLFTLRGDARWNNRPPANGRGITANDVKYSYERWAAGGLTAGRFEPVERVEAVNATTVRVVLKRPTPEVLKIFASEFHPIVNPEYLDSRGGDMGDGGTSYVGSGPFTLAATAPNVEYRWQRNPDYYGTTVGNERAPLLDGVIFRILPDAAARLAAFEAGQLDAVSLGADVRLLESYLNRQDMYVVKSNAIAGQGVLAFNLRKDPYRDERVRKAISMAIDRTLINDQVYRGSGAPAFPFPPEAVGKTSLPDFEELPPTYRQNLQEARRLLEAAGLGGGLSVGPIWYYYLYQAWEDKALLIQDMLRQIGVSSELRRVDRSRLYEMLFSGNWDGLIFHHVTTPGLTNQAWAEWMHSRARNNYWGINDPSVDTVVEQLRTELDETRRRALFQRLVDLEWEHVYRAWIDQLIDYQLVKARVVNPQAPTYLEYKYDSLRHSWLTA